MLVVQDRVMETSTTTGTGVFTLAAAVTGYRRFSDVCSVSDTAYYCIEGIDASGNPTGEWETGLGTYSSANTLTRTTVEESSNGGSAVNFSAGTKRVMISLTAAYLATELTPSGGTATPTIVQQATLRGDGTVTLGVTPTVGNFMVWVAGGHWNSIQNTYRPTGFTKYAEYNVSVNNGVHFYYRRVQSGDTGSYSVSASDNQYGVLYEIADVGGFINIQGGTFSFSGLNFNLDVFGSPSGAGALRLLVVEQDTSNDWTITAETGMTVDYHPTGGSDNHKAVFIHLDDSFDNRLTGSVATAVSDQVHGMIAIFGTPL